MSSSQSDPQVQLDRQRLREREEQLRLAQEAGGIGVFSVDITTNIITVTPHFCRLYGLEPVDTLSALDIEACIVPEDRYIASTEESRVRGNARPAVEYRIRKADTGELRWISRRAEFVQDAQGRPVRLIGVVLDVTERRRADDALSEANERIQLALNAGAVLGTWVWDIPIDQIRGDERFARTFSIDPVRCAQGLPFSILIESIHAEDRARIEAQVVRAMKSGGPYRAEYRVRQIDGSYLWIEANGHCELTAEGKPLRFPGVLINIDERKKAELRQAALIEIGDRLRELGDTAAVAGAAMEVVGRLFGLLRAGFGTVATAHQHLVVERDWVRGPGTVSVAGTHPFTAYGAYFDELLRGETVIVSDAETDPRTATAAARLRSFGIRGMVNVPLMEHGRLVAVLFLHDLEPRHWTQDEIEFTRNVADRIWAASERIKAVMELRRANETLEQRVAQRTRERDRVWNVSQDLLLVADLEGRFLSVNPAWTEVLGWSAEELLGKTSAWMEHPDDHPKTRAEVARLAEGLRTLRFENSFRHKDGSYRLLAWTAVPVPEDGLLYAFARDVTEQRQVEEQLRQAQKMEAIGQLTGGVAHDFNNLLQIIGGNLQLLQRDLAGNERAARRAQTALGAVERGARLASHLLAFSRRQPLEPLVLNLGQLLSGMEELLRRALGEHIAVETVIAPDLWNTFVDPNQLENVILNLAINARDAMQSSGKLTLEVGNALLDAPTEPLPPEVKPGEYVLLSVSDTGSGMPPDVLKRAFEPFFTTKPAGRGTGLGLSMVYGFVKQSGGHIQISSAVGVGTTLKLYLPRAAQSEATTTELLTGPVEGGNETVLVVEDDAEVRTTVVEMLSELGYRVLKAVDAQSAMAIIQSGVSVDLLFTDVVMPGSMRSTEMVRQAKALLPDLEVLFTSGYTEDAIVHEGRLDPGVHLLSKPHRREELARKVRLLLNNRQQRLEARARHDAPAHAPVAEAERRLRVLLVEDDEEIRSAAHELLEMLGHDVVSVSSAEEARGALAAGTFEVLLTDVTLPGISGLELAREAMRKSAQLRIILASGHGRAVLEGGAERWEGVVVLPKPYALEAIRGALAEAVGSR
ncbi:PAS domain-containing protein [Hyalangium rubrum]|uniref:histidine kinase n=1 Tax=Hyalangium rubrum TaxID=3103134 RepID=A0ABU5GY70_9BACT|nr:PAS domain-containing protein [Hyalangium sp. s54d21]MDY7226128.1 PAS domain-containing protein [Hyalangium sp. s54d21]